MAFADIPAGTIAMTIYQNTWEPFAVKLDVAPNDTVAEGASRTL